MGSPQHHLNMMMCPACGHLNDADAAVCENCESPLYYNEGDTVIHPTASETAPQNGHSDLPARPRPALSQQCPSCGQLNRPGVFFCEQCGTNLKTGETAPTLLARSQFDERTRHFEMPESMAETIGVEKLRKASKAGTSVFESNTLLRIYIEGTDTPLILRLSQNHPLTLGRRDGPSSSVDIDLTPYGAYQRGISRRHAAIELREKRLEIWDMGSSNGTYLNGILLGPNERHQLRDGDKVQLGKLTLQIVFQQKLDRS